MANDFVYTDEMYKEDKKISHWVFKNKIYLPKEIKEEYKNDLIQISLIQLYKARQTFNETQGVKFMTYAVKASLRKMLLFLKREDHKGKIFNKESLSKELAEDLTLEDTLGNCDIYPQLEQDNLIALKELIKAVITKPKKYKPEARISKISKRKTGLKKHQIIALEYFINGKSTGEIKDKYKISRQAINDCVLKHKTNIQKAILKSNLLD